MLVETIKENDFHQNVYELIAETIFNNPYCKFKPYPKQTIPILYASMPEQFGDDGTRKPNDVLAGAGGFGGKTFLASMLAVQYLQAPDYTCLVTRRNYAELLDTNSVWDNLLDWCCDEDRLGPLTCEFKKSPTPQITAPNGNTIYFKAFDRDEKKQKFKSASYDRIINDEASELPEAVLKFQYRSSRNTSHIPRSIINLSNPGGESTDYLVTNFVDGPKPYIALDWRDNPFIDKAAYEGSLNELDYIDQQYQKFGNWHYKPTQGDLISQDELHNAFILYNDYKSQPVSLCTMGVDLAGKGHDNTVAVSLVLLNTGIIVCNDIMIEPSQYPEDYIYMAVEKQCERNRLYQITFEAEPGSDSVYSMRHWKSVLQRLEAMYNFNINDVHPSDNKFTRARPLAKAIKDGRLKFDSRLYETLTKHNGLFDQFINVSPIPKIMKKQKSPDELDALGYAFNTIDEMIGRQVTINTGTRIGG